MREVSQTGEDLIFATHTVQQRNNIVGSIYPRIYSNLTKMVQNVLD